MTENTALWDKLGKTDPAHTKGFKRAGGFTGTAIKPIWSYRRMTEEFGPCGEGWGINEPSFQLVPAGEEILVFCTVTVWLQAKSDDSSLNLTSPKLLVGVGGDKVLTKTKYGISTDDEAFKKAFTDAVTNALKFIGVGADVHMGMFDDNKYVNTMTREFAEQATPEPAPKSSSQLKKDGEWERVSGEIANAMNDVFTYGQFHTLKESYRAEAKKNGWNRTFLEQLGDLFLSYETDLQKRIEAENEQPENKIANEMGGRIVNEHVKDQAA